MRSSTFVGCSQSPASDRHVKKLYEFGPFRVDPEKEILLRAGEPVAPTPKTFQILLVLVRHSKEVITKDDLMKAVWRDTFVGGVRQAKAVARSIRTTLAATLPPVHAD
jgi:DNA-binding winged helix-turn-helix (wHTH) protein